VGSGAATRGLPRVQPATVTIASVPAARPIQCSLILGIVSFSSTGIVTAQTNPLSAGTCNVDGTNLVAAPNKFDLRFGYTAARDRHVRRFLAESDALARNYRLLGAIHFILYLLVHNQASVSI
jgi:hypothetical protein